MSEKTLCSQKHEVNSKEIEMLSDRSPEADITAVVRHIELRHYRVVKRKVRHGGRSTGLCSVSRLNKA
jgi:hypothetical protein